MGRVGRVLVMEVKERGRSSSCWGGRRVGGL